MKKKFMLLLVLVLMLTLGSFSASAESGLTVEKVTRISDGGILVEFSEDVVIEDKNPFIGLRLLQDNGEMLYLNGAPAQFYSIDVSVIDGKTLFLTSEQGVFRQMLDYTGTYAFYKDFHLRLCIEEMVPDGVNAKGDGTVYNIKSRATGERLTATYGGPNANDGSYYVIEKDYNYFGSGTSSTDNMDDPDAQPSADEQAPTDTNPNVFIKDDTQTSSDTTVSVIHEGGNDDITWIALGIAAVDLVGILVIFVILLARNKKSKQGGGEK